MTKLATLRSQLAGLRQARSAVRGATAWSSLATALLWALAGIFLLDLLFELEVPQRVVVICLAAAGVIWAGWRFTRPLLGVSESEIDMALLVERQQKLDSDLVAALQFESPEAPAWGSTQLETAVIDYVAAVGRGINVFEGFSREQMARRGGLLAVTLLAAIVLAALFPGHAWAFFNRLALGGMHYPTDTQIRMIVVNRQPVLIASRNNEQPKDTKAAQGRPVSFLLLATGDMPQAGKVHLAATGGGSKTSLDLRALTLDERLGRVKTAAQRVADAIRSDEVDISFPWRDEVATLARLDAPATAQLIHQAKDRESLKLAAQGLAATIKDWPAGRENFAVYVGEMARLIDSVSYKVFLGDAWTDAALVQMIPLPVVEPRLKPIPPKYAAVASEAFDPAGRQVSVLEGTTIELSLQCQNGKPLASAWMLVKTKDQTHRYDLAKQDGTGLVWSLATAGSPLANIRDEIRYEIQVIDTDGLSLEMPLRGTIRIRPDRPPTGSAEVVHKVVLPEAAPVVEYRATDDYGLSSLALVAEVERFDPDREAGDSTDLGQAPIVAAQEIPAEIHRFSVLPPGQVIVAGRLPLAGKHSLDLAPLKLAKGDRVRLTLEVTDYRGENDQDQPVGTPYLSDALVLEISDESGVLAAISEADERSEQRLTDIIKRQLGIGEAP
jgi:hypothetical protein